jgi:hypothetical protein
MNKQQAAAWVRQERAKITTREQATKHLAAYEQACEGFFKSPAGIASEQADPEARKARHILAADIKAKFQL